MYQGSKMKVADGYIIRVSEEYNEIVQLYESVPLQ